MKRTLRLRTDRLAGLAPDELAAVNAGQQTQGCTTLLATLPDTCLTGAYPSVNISC